MSKPLLPRPNAGKEDLPRDNSEHDHEDTHAQRPPGPGEKPRVATEEQCLAALSGLPALVALGVLTTGKANSIRGAYGAILQHYRQKKTPDGGGGIADDALVDMLSRHPELANLLAPILSAEQIASILTRAKDGSHGTA